jgi:hypothetical protein
MTGTPAHRGPVRRCSHARASSPSHGARHGQQACRTRVRRHSACLLSTVGGVRMGWAVMAAGHVEAWLYFPSDVRIVHGHAQSGWSTARAWHGNPRPHPRSGVLAGIERGGSHVPRGRARWSPHPRGRARRDPWPRGWARQSLCPRDRASQEPS